MCIDVCVIGVFVNCIILTSYTFLLLFFFLNLLHAFAFYLCLLVFHLSVDQGHVDALRYI